MFLSLAFDLLLPKARLYHRLQVGINYRAGQNRHTSTDDLLEQDQILYSEILAILAEVVGALQEKEEHYGTTGN